VNIWGHGRFFSGANEQGYWWQNLGTSTVKVYRGAADISEEFRLKIWKHA
jgi:hypothetical protein